MEAELVTIWKNLVSEASVDGLVCEIRIPGTTMHHWQLFIDFVKGNCTYEYFIKGRKALLGKIDDLFHINGDIRSISIYIDGIVLDCHFLEVSEIEITVEPWLIMESKLIDRFFEFITKTAIRIGKVINITIEGYSEVLISFSPESGEFLYGS